MIRILTNTDFAKLEHVLPSLDRKHQAIFAILMYCGLRVGELVLLRYSDLICQAGTAKEIHVRASTAKTGVGRFVPIPKKGSDPVTLYMNTSSMKGSQWLPEYFLFPGTGSREWMSVHGVEQLVARVCLRILQRHATPHTLRHTYATRLLRFSNTREVQILLGHKKLSSTEIYTHPSTQDLKNSVDKAFK
ncbi:Tyrosine recombinase XerD [subsurface metagenome]